MSDPAYRDFHRIVYTNPATLIDFESQAARGRAAPDDPNDLPLWYGLSVYNTAAQARKKQRVSPMLGDFIAVVRVPLDGSIRIERTRGAGHYTLWADATALLKMVIAVEPV